MLPFSRAGLVEEDAVEVFHYLSSLDRFIDSLFPMHPTSPPSHSSIILQIILFLILFKSPDHP